MDTRREDLPVIEKHFSKPVKNWFAVYTRPRFEKQVSRRLAEQGIEAYCPLVKSMRQWSDRKKTVELPLFSSYVFVRISRKEYDLVLKTHGVVKYVSFEGKAASIPSEQIDNLKIIVNSNEKVECTWERYKKGQRVEVKAGSLKGLKGELISDGKRNKVLVRIEGIEQNLTIEVHSSLIGQVKE